MLRFLAGLALIALAFAAHVTSSPAAVESPAPTAAVAEAARPEAARPEMTSPASAAAATIPFPHLPVVAATPPPALAATVVVPGVMVRAHAVRGPPLS